MKKHECERVRSDLAVHFVLAAVVVILTGWIAMQPARAASYRDAFGSVDAGLYRLYTKYGPSHPGLGGAGVAMEATAKVNSATTGTRYVGKTFGMSAAQFFGVASKAAKFSLKATNAIGLAMLAAELLVPDDLESGPVYRDANKDGQPDGGESETSFVVYQTVTGGVPQIHETFADALSLRQGQCSAEHAGYVPMVIPSAPAVDKTVSMGCGPVGGSSKYAYPITGRDAADYGYPDGVTVEGEPTPVDPGEVGDVLARSPAVRDAVSDAVQANPDAQDAVPGLRDWLDDLKDALTDADTNPDSEVDPALAGSNSNAPQDAAQAEHPTDCDLFQPGCEIRDFLKKDDDSRPPPPDVVWDIQELGAGDFAVDNRLAGAGACPAPTTLDIYGQAITWTWQPACDFVVMFKPALLAGGWLIALLIVVRQK